MPPGRIFGPMPHIRRWLFVALLIVVGYFVYQWYF